MRLSLRDYQEEAVQNIRTAFSSHRSVLFTLATGGGKTVIFSYITENAAKKGNKIMIVVHRQELVLQSSLSLSDLGVKHHIVAPEKVKAQCARKQIEKHGRCDISENTNVAIASVQTLVRRLHELEGVKLLIIDEAHHSQAASWRKVIDYSSKAKVLGVTATPIRLDGKGLANFYDAIVIGKQTDWLIKNEYLSPIKIFAPEQTEDMSQVKKRYGDFVLSEAEGIFDKPTITGSAIAQYQKHCDGQPAIAYCCSISHAVHTAELFKKKGYNAIQIDGSTDKSIRYKAIDDLAAGRVHLISSVDIISEGTDVPIVGCGILLRPTQSQSLYLQQVGRVLRKYPGKECAYILDHVGNIFRHGHPQIDRDWQLTHTKIKNEKAIAIKQCKQCYYCYPPEPVCPNCGHKEEPKGRAPLVEREGELKEVSPDWAGGVDVISAPLKKVSGKARTLADLQELGRLKGYKPGWAYNVWKSRNERKTRKS